MIKLIKRKQDYKALFGRGLILWILLMLVIFFTSGCIEPPSDCINGSGNVVTGHFTVNKFHSAEYVGSGNLYVFQGTPQSLRIEAEDNILDVIRANVVNGKLNIVLNRCYRNTKPIDIYITMEEVRDLSGSGSVNIIGKTEINTESLKLSLSGSGYSDLTLNVEELETILAGSGKSTLRGTAKVHNSVISGSGNIMAFDLATERTDITISGFGDAHVDASRELDISVFGSGNVYYTGNATVSQTITGSGRVEKG